MPHGGNSPLYLLYCIARIPERQAQAPHLGQSVRGVGGFRFRGFRLVNRFKVARKGTSLNVRVNATAVHTRFTVATSSIFVVKLLAVLSRFNMTAVLAILLLLIVLWAGCVFVNRLSKP